MEGRQHLSEVEGLRLVIETQRLINAVIFDPDKVMSVVTERAQAITRATGGVVELVSGEEMVYRSGTGSATGSLGERLRKDASLSGLCVTYRQPLRCDDSESDPRVDREACRRIGVRSMIVVPLLHGPEPVGALKVMSGVPNHFDDVDLEILQLMADFIADALSNSTSHAPLGHDAMHDNLTGLPNRALLMDRLDQALHRAARNGSTVCVFFLDLDGFKTVNDNLGHARGDDVLRAVAREMSKSARAEETLARFGGDEFVLVCEGLDAATSRAVADRVRGAVERAVEALDCYGLGVSIGIAWSKGPSSRADELLVEADTDMYEEKRLRRRA
jgi:diguanylate cyclase (GGDEF)-like protein